MEHQINYGCEIQDRLLGMKAVAFGEMRRRGECCTLLTFFSSETKEAVGIRRASYQVCFQTVGIKGSWKETEGRAALLSGEVKVSVASKVNMAFL